MLAIEQAIRLVSEPPGSLIYHLTLLFAIWAALMASTAHWRRTGSPRAGALLAAASGLLILRGVLMGAAALAWQGLLNPETVLPPLDRAVTTAVILLLVWALALARHNRLAYLALGLLLLFTLIGYIASATSWAGELGAGRFYNGSSQETAWELVDFIGLGLGLLILLWQRPAAWGLSLGLFGLLLAGHIVHYAFPLPDTHIAGAERLAELAALPMFAVISLRAVLHLDEEPAQRPKETTAKVKPPAAAEKPKPGVDPQLINDLAALSAVDGLTELGPAVARAAARALRADMSVLVVPGTDRNSASIPYGYDLIREQVIPGKPLDLSLMPALASALQRGKALRISAERHAPELTELARVLYANQPGPALAVPMEKAGRSLGLILLFSPYSQRQWTPEDQYQLTHLAGAMTSALIRHEALAELNRKHETATARLDEATRQLIQTQAVADRLTQDLDSMRTRTDIEREQSRNLAARMNERGDPDTIQEMRDQLVELQTALGMAQTRAAEAGSLHAELAQARAAAVEAEDMRRELAENADTIRRLQAQLSAGSESREGGSDEAGRLEQELRQALEQNAYLTSRLSDADMRMAELEAERGAASGAQGQLPEKEVISSVTQELRQPMSSIVGYTDLLLGESVGILGALQRKFLERVKLSTERMGTLLDDLIRVTAIDTGTLELDPEAVDIIGVIDDALTHSGSQFREKNITLRMDIAEDLPQIHADRDAMSQIMTHLLGNAASASRTDGEVVISAQYQIEAMDGGEAGFLMVSVTDSGVGIAGEDRPRVFTRLYRADNPLIEGLGDTGVGLSIVKALAEAHGGRIWVDSETGVGSTFSLLIPVESEAVAENGAGPR